MKFIEINNTDLAAQKQYIPGEIMGAVANIDDAEHFLSLIAPDKTEFCFRSINHLKDGAKNYTDTLEHLADELINKNCVKHDGVFVVINDGGHKDDAIVKIRAVFCDWDDPATAEQLCGEASKLLMPHIIVESSPHKRHAYWLVDDVSVERFSLWQDHLIRLFESDKSIKNKSRVMRLPGFLHTKEELFMTKVIHEMDRAPYSEACLVAAFGQPEKTHKAMPVLANSANSANSINNYESICIGRVVTILQAATQGSRHEARLKAGMLAGGFIAGGHVDGAKITDIFMQVSDSISDKGVTDPSERKAIYEAIEMGRSTPRKNVSTKQLSIAPALGAVASPVVLGMSVGNQVLPPEPLRAPLSKSVPYPYDALGVVLGSAAQAIHETVKAPLALCCQSILASASLVVQAHFDVLLPWGGLVPLSLLLLTVGESGERKSAVDNLVLGPAKKMQEQDMIHFKVELKKYKKDMANWKAKSAANNKTFSKSKTLAFHNEDTDLEGQHDDEPERPIRPVRFVTDPTIEGLYKLFEESQPSIGLFSDEGGLLIGGHALNNDNALKTMARWCKLWDGSSFDRVRGGDDIGDLTGRRFTMHQMAQPEVMVRLLGDRMANGQGFLARCLVAWPESTIGSRQIVQFVLPQNRNEIRKLFAVLKKLIDAVPRTKNNSTQELDPVALSLDHDAHLMAIAANNKFEGLMQKGNDLYELRDRASKALENACRIAGILAVIDGGMATRSISAEHLARGLILIQWYLDEALRVRGESVVPQSVIDAESLSRWLNSRAMTEFNTTPVLTSGPSQLRSITRLMPAISELVNNGFLQPNKTGTRINGVLVKNSWKVLHYVV